MKEEINKLYEEEKEIKRKRKKLLEELYRKNKKIATRPNITLKEALKKTYYVRISSKTGKVGCRLNLPLCFKDKKIKLRIVK